MTVQTRRTKNIWIGHREIRKSPRTSAVRSPFATLRWWEWVKIVGAAGVVILVIALVSGHTPPPVVVAVLLHIFADFTCQSSETAAHKEERGRHLLVHALAAGGIPLAVAGLITGNPATALTWISVSVVSHYAVDWTRKFGLRQAALGVILDQACHLATIVALTMLLY
jgi:hypothetical protein